MTKNDKIVYIINGGKHGNGYIALTKWTGFKGDVSWIPGGASCGLHKKSIDEIKREFSFGNEKTKFIIVKLPQLPK